MSFNNKILIKTLSSDNTLYIVINPNYALFNKSLHPKHKSHFFTQVHIPI